MERIAIVLGTYNRRPHLERAVESLRKTATGLDLTIIAVDGGSTDGSREWLAAQPDVVLIGQRGPLTGAVRAFNLGFAYAIDHEFPFIGHFNDDAEAVTDGMWKTAVDMLLQDPQAGDVAFEFDLWVRYRFDSVYGKVYSNFGVLRREAAMAVARAQGDPTGRDVWNPIYRTYAADTEVGAWLWKLGWKVLEGRNLRVHDVNAKDDLRHGNETGQTDSKLFYSRWTDAKQLEPQKTPRFSNGSKIHIGCGTKHLKGWINCDGVQTPAADTIIDLYDTKAIPSGCAHEIYWSHGPEHIFPDKLPKVLKELRRILHTEGALMLATIDFEGIYQNRYKAPKNGPEWNAALYGECDSKDHPFLAHRQAFTRERLSKLLTDAGFAEVTPWSTEAYPEIHALNDYARSCALVTIALRATA